MALSIAVVGGGAAGFFAAISAKKHFPNTKVVLFEKSGQILAKVKISGGGRCNVTNACFDLNLLSKHYPRGERQLRKAFSQFDAQSTVDWFESRGVPLKTYTDNCIFPQANSSQAIIDCLLKEAAKLGVEIKLNSGLRAMQHSDGTFILSFDDLTQTFDRIIVATGGQPKISGLEWISKLGLDIVSPVPSLFTFNMPNNPIRELMGNVVEKAVVKIEGTKLEGRGPLLVTHWGMSGPAILQLSAWGARILADKKYQFRIYVNWLNGKSEADFRMDLAKLQKLNADKMLQNANPFPITSKLWLFLIEKHGISPQSRWKELGARPINKLITAMLFDPYNVLGKTTFKEEFVTAGGVALNEIDFKTMQSKQIAGLAFVGELLDIDGITGGFNFQAAWTTGFIAGKHIGL